MSYRMNRLREEELTSLQDAIQANVDSSRLFEDAAVKIKNERMSDLFRDIAQQRRANAEELKPFVIAAGEKPDDKPSLGGQTREIWLRFRSALNGGDAYVLLAEAERSEDHLKEIYTDAIRHNAGSPAAQTLHQQFAIINKQHNAVRDLRDAHEENR
jgi:uncharacterized protein (TIGR02284 family)